MSKRQKHEDCDSNDTRGHLDGCAWQTKAPCGYCASKLQSRQACVFRNSHGTRTSFCPTHWKEVCKQRSWNYKMSRCLNIKLQQKNYNNGDINALNVHEYLDDMPQFNHNDKHFEESIGRHVVMRARELATQKAFKREFDKLSKLEF